MPSPLTPVEVALVKYVQQEQVAVQARWRETLALIAKSHGVQGQFDIVPDGQGFALTTPEGEDAV